MTLVVTVEEVARRLGLPQPLEESDRWLVEQALQDAQDDLEAYLGRSLTPQTFTDTGMLPICGQYRLRNWPVISITSTTAETYPDSGQPTGRFTVTYVAGLDGLNDPEMGAVRRFVRTHAIYSDTVQALYRRLSPAAARKITNLSVEGQSVTYTDTYAVEANASASGLPGALPTFKSCDRWRLAGRRVHQADTHVHDIWPFTRSPRWWHSE